MSNPMDLKKVLLQAQESISKCAKAYPSRRGGNSVTVLLTSLKAETIAKTALFAQLEAIIEGLEDARKRDARVTLRGEHNASWQRGRDDTLLELTQKLITARSELLQQQ